jgi:hypothetical protein
LPGSRKIKEAKFGRKQFQKRTNSQMCKRGQIEAKFSKKIYQINFGKMDQKDKYYLSRYYHDLKKAKKWPNHFISGKLYQRGQIRLIWPF